MKNGATYELLYEEDNIKNGVGVQVKLRRWSYTGTSDDYSDIVDVNNKFYTKIVELLPSILDEMLVFINLKNLLNEDYLKNKRR